MVSAAVLACVCLLARAGGVARADGAPQRIVSLAPALTELVFALGVGDRLVGATAQCDFPPQALTLPRVGTFLSPNVEAVLHARPDIVLVSPSPGNRRAVEQLRNLGLRVFVVDPQTVQDLAATVRQVGKALGVEEHADRLADRFVASIEATQRLVASCPPRKVLFVVGRNPLIAVGSGTMQDELIHLAGGTNVVRAHGWPKVSIESVLQAGPEVIIDATMGSDSTNAGDGVAFWDQFPLLPAVKNRRVVIRADDRILRPGPRLPEGLRALAEDIHPEAFTNVAPAE
ncbi:MAG: cobalamin-binding protein [Candidatus Binatia bacterium]|nr:cobalamin-binding protein [Candidatus Binatia bacterium]